MPVCCRSRLPARTRDLTALVFAAARRGWPRPRATDTALVQREEQRHATVYPVEVRVDLEGAVAAAPASSSARFATALLYCARTWPDRRRRRRRWLWSRAARSRHRPVLASPATSPGLAASGSAARFAALGLAGPPAATASALVVGQDEAGDHRGLLDRLGENAVVRRQHGDAVAQRQHLQRLRPQLEGLLRASYDPVR